MLEKERSPLGFFGRYLSLWVTLCIATGITIGSISPSLFEVISRLEYAKVNFVIAVLIWVMIYPMMVQVDFSSLKNLAHRPKGLVITIVMNWLIKPFSMALIGILFFKYIFVGFVNVQDAKEYIAGMILLGVAPCTAMVFVWSQLVKGDSTYTLVQVSINDLIMVLAFAPITAFLLGVTDILVPWETLLLSVVLYIVIPLVAGYFTRYFLTKSNQDDQRLQHFSQQVEPYSIVGLLVTIVILFGLQATTILRNPFIIGLIAIPLVLQTCGIFALAYAWAYFWKIPHNVAAPAALISTSNFFELA